MYMDPTTPAINSSLESCEPYSDNRRVRDTRSGITVDIHEMAGLIMDSEILRFSGHNVNKIVVTKVSDSAVNIISKLFHKRTFQVEEWPLCWLRNRE